MGTHTVEERRGSEGARGIGKKGWRTGLLKSQAGPCSEEGKGVRIGEGCQIIILCLHGY